MSEKDKKSPSEPTINIASHNQMGGITAHTVYQRPPERVLNEEAKAQILQLPRDKPIHLIVEGNAAETVNLANQLRPHLLENGYDIKNAKLSWRQTFGARPSTWLTAIPKDHEYELVVWPNQ